MMVAENEQFFESTKEVRKRRGIFWLIFSLAVSFLLVSLVFLILVKPIKEKWPDCSFNPFSQKFLSSSESIENPERVVGTSPGWETVAGYFDLAVKDNIDPCENFFLFSCGQFQQKERENPWMVLYQKARKDFDDAIRNFTVTPESPRALRQTKLVYDKCMNMTYSSKENVTKIKNFIDMLGGWPLVFQNLSNPDWNPYYLMGALNAMNIDNIFSCPPYLPCVMPNWADDTQGNMLFLGSANTLVSKEEYQTEGAKATEWARRGVMDVVEEMSDTFHVKPDPDVLKNEIDIMFLMDYKLAMNSEHLIVWELANMSDAFHPFTLDEAKSRWPSFDWEAYMRAIAVGKIDPELLLNRTFNLVTPDFVDVLAELPITPGKGARYAQNYLIFKFITMAMRVMPGFEHHYLRFKQGSDKGIPGPVNDRHRVCKGVIEDYLKDTTARVFVDSSFNHLPGEPRDKLDFMTDLVLDGFKEMISKTGWMSDATREEAFQKIFNVQKNIAYPAWIVDDLVLDARHPVDRLDIREDDDPFDMIVKLCRFVTWTQWRIYSEPIDRTTFGDWANPMTVNAWYQPWFNSITFPAAFLHAPIFEVDFPMAFNFGGLGVVMGHELVHGFDVTGSQFDDMGSLRRWIDDQSEAGYKNMTDCLVDQYNNCCYAKWDVCVNGTFTLSENIADNGGLAGAYNAYQKYVEQFGEEPRLPGKWADYSMEKIFFMSFAHIWCEDANHDPSGQIGYDVHSPALWRVIATLRDFPPFAKAFECKPDSGMAPKDHCDGWWPPSGNK